MAFTEEEAKTKWCPFARAINWAGTASGNRDLQDAPYDILRVNCIGSACMAWHFNQWHDTRDKELWHIARNERVNSGITGEVEWRPVNPDEPPPPKTGFCGLVHQP